MDPRQVHGFSTAEQYVGTALTMRSPASLPRAIVEARPALYRYDRPPLLHPARDQLAALESLVGSSCSAST